jgi:hypothetical protein
MPKSLMVYSTGLLLYDCWVSIMKVFLLEPSGPSFRINNSQDASLLLMGTLTFRRQVGKDIPYRMGSDRNLNKINEFLKEPDAIYNCLIILTKENVDI